MSESIAVRAALDLLRDRLEQATDPQDLVHVLRVLQRSGLSRTELQIHVETRRAQNDVTARNETVEENALLALDIIMGEASSASLRWDATELAAIYLNKSLDHEAIS